MRSTAEKEGLPSSVQEPSQQWQDAVLECLRRGGPVCQHAATYIARNGVRIRFRRQHTGARWTLGGAIELNLDLFLPQNNPADPRLLGAVVHEATHLEQGPAVALSVQGEVEGWRAEFLARAELNAPIADTHWQAVASASTSPTDHELRKARSKMMEMTGRRYLVWLLPLRANWLTALAGRVAGRMQRNG